MRFSGTFAVFFLGLVLATLAQTGPPRALPKTQGGLYDWVTSHRGEKLRPFVTHSKTCSWQRPRHILGWLAQLRQPEVPGANTRDGFSIFMPGLIDESGYATMRRDKPGAEESQGDCSKVDSKRDERLAGRIRLAARRCQ